MNVSAIIVTRGDVPVQQILEEIPERWEVLLWDNGRGRLSRWGTPQVSVDDIGVSDLSVYGRYAAIEYASHDVIYVQDDDVIVSDPQAIVDGLTNHWGWREYVWCNMPQEFRHDFYTDHALVGFGAAFHRDTPAKAFDEMWRYVNAGPKAEMLRTLGPAVELEASNPARWPNHFHRTCDIVFTGLTPRVLVDVPKENLPWAHSENRMWRQPEHQGERARMRELMLQVRKEIP